LIDDANIIPFGIICKYKNLIVIPIGII